MDWKSRVRTAFVTSEHVPDDEVVEELAQHARAMYEAARVDGLSIAEADRRVSDQLHRWCLDGPALRRGPRRATSVEPPEVIPSSPANGLVQDVRYAVRLLRRQPRYTALTTLTLALGIGATTVLFSLTYGVLVKPLPWARADRLIVLKETRGGRPPRFGSFSNAAYLAWRERATTIEHLAAWSQQTVTLAGAGDPERIRITNASASLFTALGARPLIGSLFDQGDELGQNGPVIVLSERLWRRRFGGNPAALGTLERLDGRLHRIIGVLPDAMAYPDREAQAWVPFHVRPATDNVLSMFNAVGRLRPGVTPAQAASEGTARGRLAADTGMTTMAIFGTQGPVEVSALPFREAATADVRRPLVVLLVAVGLLLATATANVAGLQLARATTRRREIAIRAALGAGRARLRRQFLVESLLLGLIGGGAGLCLAWALHRVMLSLLPAGFPRADDLRIDALVVLFGLVVSAAISIVLGASPVRHVRRLNLVESLAENGMAPVGSGSRSRTVRTRLLVMAGQVAIACMLLIGASLLGRSFIALLTADRGYEPSGVLTSTVSLPASLYTPEHRYLMLGQILGRLGAVAQVTDAAFTSDLPLTPGGSTAAFTLRSRDGGTVSAQASPRIVSPRYFSAVGMRIVAGRGFTDADTEIAPAVVVVNRAFARRYLGASPLGARMPMGVGHGREREEATVVGVVNDVRYLTAADASQPEMYYAYRQFDGRLTVPVVNLVMRTTGDPGALSTVLRTIVREADDALVPGALMPMEERMLTSLARPRLYAVLLGAFAVLALIVAAVGLFGVLSYSVAQRSRELAVRAALGARRIDLYGLVLGQGLAVTGLGLAAGLLGSLALMRSIDGLLYGVTRYDSVTYVAVSVGVVVVAVAACLVPARDAASIDPIRALRSS